MQTRTPLRGGARHARGMGRGMLVAAALCALGCGTETRSAAAGATRRVDVLGQSVEVVQRPSRIVAANTSALEFAAALVGWERLAAVPAVGMEYAALPEEDDGWRARPRLAAFDAESILALEPDLVLVHDWQSADTVRILSRSGVAVLVLPTVVDWPEVIACLTAVGTLVGEDERALALCASLEDRRRALEAAGDALVDGRRARVLAYGNYGTGGSTAGSRTTWDLMIRLSGCLNAAREAGIEGHANIDFERLVVIDPDVLLLSDGESGTGGPTLTELERLDSRGALSALTDGRLITLPKNLFSTSSHRVLDAAEILAERVRAALAK